MKVFKAILALIGLGGLIAAGAYLGLVWVDNERLLAAANANKSGNLFPSPMTNIFIASGLGAIGGLLLGIGVGMPLRTAGQVRRELEAERAAISTATPDSGDAAHG